MNSANSSMETEQVTATNTRYSKNLYTSIQISFKTSDLKGRVRGGGGGGGGGVNKDLQGGGGEISIELLERGHTFSDFGG